MGCFMYLIFGSCKDIVVGPAVIMSLLTAQYALGRPDFAILLCFLTGLIAMLLGLLRLGKSTLHQVGSLSSISVLYPIPHLMR